MEMMESTKRFQRQLELESGKRGNPESGDAIQMYKIKRKHFTHNEPMLLSTRLFYNNYFIYQSALGSVSSVYQLSAE